MNFKDKYTTEDKVKADKTGKEKDKSIITNDTYVLGDIFETMRGEIKAILRSKI
jgi:hypothetical protein